MEELELVDAEREERSRYLSSLWGKRIGFSLSLPQWGWAWRLRMPRFRIRLGQGSSGAASGDTDEETAGQQRRLPRFTLPSLNSAVALIIIGRVLAAFLVLGFLYLLFMSDLFSSMARRMGSQMFDPESVRAHVQGMVSPSHMRDNLKHFTSYAHLAGSEGDYALAVDTKNLFVKYGLEDVTVDEYFVYLNYPKEDGGRAVEILDAAGKAIWSAKLEEQERGGEAAGHQTYAFHGHSKAGHAQGPLIYANYGSKEDFKTLYDSGIDTKGAIALVRNGGPDEDLGMKVKAAELAGFVGCLIYNDPADNGFLKGETAPNGRWMPSDALVRGSVSLKNYIVGDPLTPGWESTRGMPRLELKNSPALVKIPSLPLAWRDAQKLLQHIKGFGQHVTTQWTGGVPDVDEWWSGNLSSPIVHLKNEQDEDQQKPIWNVYGRIQGAEQGGKSVIIGNHRDSWAFGATDPHSGTAVMLEAIRILADLAGRGWRPLRTIEFMSWDAEEYNLMGSTEFVEKHTEGLRDDALAYINLDDAVTGDSFHVSGSPVFRRLVLQILNRVSDPNFNTTLRELFDRRKGDMEPLGMDSDYVAFRDIAGTSSIDLRFEGEGVLSQSNYDNFDWMDRVGDPGFVYHTLLGQIVVLLIVELADRPILPFDMVAYADSLVRWVTDLQEWSTNKGLGQAGQTPVNMLVLQEAADEVAMAVREFIKWELSWETSVVASSGWEPNSLGRKRLQYNSRMAKFETNLLDLETGGGVSFPLLNHYSSSRLTDHSLHRSPTGLSLSMLCMGLLCGPQGKSLTSRPSVIPSWLVTGLRQTKLSRR
jgi:hypothetical protein